MRAARQTFRWAANQLHHTVNSLHLLHEIRNFRELPYEAKVLETEEEILQARRLLADVYLANGAIDESYLSEQGTLKDEFDPYYRRATYFGTYDPSKPDELLATARLIHPRAGGGVDTLQLHIDDLEPEWQKELRMQDPRGLAEFASLVKKRETGSMPTLFLIREMFHFSREYDIDWVCGLKPELLAKFVRQFGDALEPMGQKVHLGNLKPTYVPLRIDTKKGLENLLNTKGRLIQSIGKRAMSAFMSEGLDRVLQQEEQIQLNLSEAA